MADSLYQYYVTYCPPTDIYLTHTIFRKHRKLPKRRPQKYISLDNDQHNIGIKLFCVAVEPEVSLALLATPVPVPPLVLIKLKTIVLGTYVSGQ